MDKNLERWIGKEVRGACKSENTYCGDNQPCSYEGLIFATDQHPTLGTVLRLQTESNGVINVQPKDFLEVKQGCVWIKVTGENK